MKKNLKPKVILLFLVQSLIGMVATAATAGNCDRLTPEQSAKKAALFQKIHAYNGCDQTLDKCLAVKEPHFSVQHTAADVCRLIKENKSDSEIRRAVSNRAASLLPGIRKAAVEMDMRTLAGDPNAPVTVTVYACTRCPFCKVLVPRLYRAVTGGSLKGKVRVIFRPFPIKSHEGALEGGLALEAAATLGKFWPFLNLVYTRYDQFCPKLLGDWAAETGMDKEAFEILLRDPKIRAQVVASKQEGIVNKVIATPTLFIDGTEYVYDLSEGVLEDVLEEAFLITGEKKPNP